MGEIKNKKIHEAYLNEYKGGLFEYLTGLKIAQLCKIESDFYSQMSPSLKVLLVDYEQKLMDLNPELFVLLPTISTDMGKFIFDSLELKKQAIKKVLICGKKIGNSNQNNNRDESDLVVQGREEFRISLKFAKKNSFVNTKSAGIKTLFSHYFDKFQQAHHLQQELNHLLDLQFYKMYQKMCLESDIPFHEEIAFYDWPLAHLPGELDQTLTPILYEYYDVLIQKIIEILKQLYSDDRELFFQSLLLLCGATDSNVLQFFCFHWKNYQETEFLLMSVTEYLNENIELNFIKSATNHTSVELDFHPKFLLQIRVKPMNTFTVKSLKVNCSIKLK